MAVAIYPGTFDPITYGHLDVIQRTAKVFDKVIIGVLVNHTKKPMFTTEERVEMIREVTESIPNVEVISFDGLLVEFCKTSGIDVIIRGVRAISDFEYEMTMAQTNKELYDDIETMFFVTDSRYSFVSSSAVRELAMFGASIEKFVPEKVRKHIYQKYRDKYPEL